MIRPHERNRGTAQTPGLEREAGIDETTVRSRGLWMGFVRMAPAASSTAHHHGRCESGIYVIHGSLQIRFGEGLLRSANAYAGDFIYVPPRAVHREVNLSSDEPVDQIVVRDSPKNIVVPVAGRGRRR